MEKVTKENFQETLPILSLKEGEKKVATFGWGPKATKKEGMFSYVFEVDGNKQIYFNTKTFLSAEIKPGDQVLLICKQGKLSCDSTKPNQGLEKQNQKKVSETVPDWEDINKHKQQIAEPQKSQNNKEQAKQVNIDYAADTVNLYLTIVSHLKEEFKEIFGKEVADSIVISAANEVFKAVNVLGRGK